jgi:hypothetical protein
VVVHCYKLVALCREPSAAFLAQFQQETQLQRFSRQPLFTLQLNMGVKTLFPPSTVKPQSQYSIGANVANGKTGAKKTGFGFLSGDDVAVR